MSKLRKVMAATGLLLAASVVQAASLVATVDSSAPLLIKGKRVPAAGINHWPAFQGDRIATTGAPALVSFRDGSFVMLDKDTEIVLAGKDGKVAVKMVKGQLTYKLSDYTTMAFENVAQTAKSGTLAVENGSISVLSNAGFFAQLERHTAASPGTYPIQINWNSVPTGVTTSDGPPPVSAYRP